MIWIFIAVENNYLLNLFKWTKTSLNIVMQPTTSNNHSRPIFPYHVQNQVDLADFDSLFINRKGFIYLGISKMSFTF